MGADAGASGAFGLLLSEYAGKLGDAYEEFRAAMDTVAAGSGSEDDEDPTGGADLDERLEVAARRWAEKLVQRFAELKITVPTGARLLYTGNEDDRPARTATDPDDWVLGFGLYLSPWKYPPMAGSFRKAARWHTWVWME